ncbi:MAG: HAD family hydrolase [Alphaproteobacteria bacterium]
MSAPGLLIFDCDGVLVDSESIEHGVDLEIFADHGYRLTSAELLARFIGISRRDCYRIVFDELGRPIPDGLQEEAERRVRERCRTELKPIAGIEDALRALDGLAKCVASSSTPNQLAMKLDVTGLTPWFAPHIYSTALVARGKPAPDIYLHGACALGHAPVACVVIEDSPHGVAGARAAGMRAIGFAGGGHAGDDLARALRDAGAEAVLTRMADLPAAVAAR